MPSNARDRCSRTLAARSNPAAWAATVERRCRPDCRLVVPRPAASARRVGPIRGADCRTQWRQPRQPEQPSFRSCVTSTAILARRNSPRQRSSLPCRDQRRARWQRPTAPQRGCRSRRPRARTNRRRIGPCPSCCAEVSVSFIEGTARDQVSLLPPSVDDDFAPDAMVRVVDAFVASLNLAERGFGRAVAAGTGRPVSRETVIPRSASRSSTSLKLRVKRRCNQTTCSMNTRRGDRDGRSRRQQFSAERCRASQRPCAWFAPFPLTIGCKPSGQSG